MFTRTGYDKYGHDSANFVFYVFFSIIIRPSPMFPPMKCRNSLLRRPSSANYGRNVCLMLVYADAFPAPSLIRTWVLPWREAGGIFYDFGLRYKGAWSFFSRDTV